MIDTQPLFVVGGSGFFGSEFFRRSFTEWPGGMTNVDPVPGPPGLEHFTRVPKSYLDFDIGDQFIFAGPPSRVGQHTSLQDVRNYATWIEGKEVIFLATVGSHGVTSVDNDGSITNISLDPYSITKLMMARVSPISIWLGTLAGPNGVGESFSFLDRMIDSALQHGVITVSGPNQCRAITSLGFAVETVLQIAVKPDSFSNLGRRSIDIALGYYSMIHFAEFIVEDLLALGHKCHIIVDPMPGNFLDYRSSTGEIDSDPNLAARHYIRNSVTSKFTAFISDRS